MDVFEFNEYRPLIKDLLAAKPKGPKGVKGAWADALNISSAMVSQILGGRKGLTEDQAFLSAEFFSLTPSETAYLILLVQRDRAGFFKLKDFYQKQIVEAKEQAKSLRSRVKVDKKLNQAEQAFYYSDWTYIAVHTLSSVHGLQTIDAMTKHLGIARNRVAEAAEFLVKIGLCKESGGKYSPGALKTFVDKDSPLVNRHHINWRLQAMEKMYKRKLQDFFFTAPISISQKDFEAFRKELVAIVDRLAQRVSQTKPESMAVINIDYFSY